MACIQSFKQSDGGGGLDQMKINEKKNCKKDLYSKAPSSSSNHTILLSFIMRKKFTIIHFDIGAPFEIHCIVLSICKLYSSPEDGERRR